MSADVTVRAATGDDAAAVRRITREAWHAAYGEFIDASRIDETIDAWYDTDRLVADDIDPPDRPFFVAVVGDDVAGFVEAASGDEGVAHLYRIYVAPEYWHRGIGSSLLERIEQALRERGFDRLVLSVFAENTVGVQFYESSGFLRTDSTYSERFDTREYEYAKEL
ncbi:MAG: GNAT family N-acetyltransferase [Halovenus sp.]